VIVCPRCSKENQDHYKFCLGCGSELPRDSAAAARPAVPSVPTSSSPAAPAAPAEPALLSPAAPSAEAASPVSDKALAFEFASTQQGDDDLEAVVRGAVVASVVPSVAVKEREEVPVSPVVVAVPPANGAGGGLGSAVSTASGTAQRPAVSVSSVGAVPNACPACGNPVPVDFKFCGTCGQRMPGAGAAAAPAAGAVNLSGRPQRGTLVVINPDGTEGGTFPLAEGTTNIGRSHGSLFSADAYLSPSHATITIQGSSCSVRDENSLNGIYVKLKRDVPTKLSQGDIFRIGQELIRFELLEGPQSVGGVEPMGSPNPGYVGRLSLVIGRESSGNGFPIPAEGLHLGRERGDVIFPEDGYVSGLHCRVHYDGSGCVLTDVGSSNGTFLRIRGSKSLISGDLLLMGQQLFRLQF